MVIDNLSGEDEGSDMLPSLLVDNFLLLLAAGSEGYGVSIHDERPFSVSRVWAIGLMKRCSGHCHTIAPQLVVFLVKIVQAGISSRPKRINGIYGHYNRP